MAVQTYRELDVWQKAMDLVVAVYQLTEQFPVKEQFGLTNQLQRATVSIPANIAEGFGRIHHGDYLRFLSIARGSLMEAETHVQIALRLGYVEREQLKPVWNIFQDVARLLNGLIRSLRNTEVPDRAKSKNIREEIEGYGFTETE